MSGHRLGAGAVDEDKWRCPVCTFLNKLSSEACRRCREPTTDAERAEYLVKAVMTSAPTTRPPRGAAPPPARAAKKTKAVAAKPTTRKTVTSSSSAAAAAPSSEWKPGKNKKVHTVKHKTASVRKQPKQQFHKGDLGYKPAKGGNVKTFTRSKLNHATVAYAMKYQKDDDSEEKKRQGNIHTVSSGKVNGFVAPAKMPRKKNPWDEKVVPKPAKYRMGSSGKKKGQPLGTIARLQQMASTGAVASLKHTKREVAPSVKTMGTTHSKLAM